MTGLILTIFLLWGLGTISLSAPIINVVYPRAKPGERVSLRNVDSNFVFGSLQPPTSRLWINEHEVAVRPSGAFFAFLPVDWQNLHYRFLAVDFPETTRIILPFQPMSPPPPPSPPDLKPPVGIKILNGVGRNHPSGTYYYFPPSDLVLRATRWAQGYWEVPLGNGRSAWFDQRSVTAFHPPPESTTVVVWRAEVQGWGKGACFVLPIPQPRLWRVYPSSQPQRLTLELYHTVSHLDLIHYLPQNKFVEEVRWEASGEESVALTFYLSRPLWGYSIQFRNDTLFAYLREPPPSHRKGLKNLKIVIDPGHGGDQDGAIGPLGTKEKDINLQVALALEKRLQEKGGQVFLTRREDKAVSLQERTRLAEEWGGDLFLSIHHNALADGNNPASSVCGTSVHYYHPTSLLLARSIQNRLVKELGFPDEGIYYHDLAVARLTFMPSVLIELAHIILPEQEEVILSPDYRERTAKAITQGLIDFFQKYLHQ